MLIAFVKLCKRHWSVETRSGLEVVLKVAGGGPSFRLICLGTAGAGVDPAW